MDLLQNGQQFVRLNIFIDEPFGSNLLRFKSVYWQIVTGQDYDGGSGNILHDPLGQHQAIFIADIAQIDIDQDEIGPIFAEKYS